MPIEFRKQKDAVSTGQEKPPTPPVQPASKVQAEERLFYFLRSLCAGRPQVPAPLFVEEATLHALYTQPDPNLIVALQHCLDQSLIEIGADATSWGRLDLSTTLFGVALAAYNCLCPQIAPETMDPLLPFTVALIDTLPPARTLSEMLAYHALLCHAAEFLDVWSEERAALMRALLNRSPLSALYYLHLYTPSPLTVPTAEIWADLEDWLQTLALLLAQPTITGFLRRRWLSMPETLLTCRNLGLLLEALRLKGDHDRFILEFYEAFEFFRAREVTDPWYGTVRSWPLLEQIKRLLYANGDNEAAIQLNRRGKEYFSLFRPLLNIVGKNDLPPDDYYYLHHLTQNFIQALYSLSRFIPDNNTTRPSLGTIEFISEDEE